MEDIRKGVCPLCQHKQILEATPQLNAVAHAGGALRGSEQPHIAMIASRGNAAWTLIKDAFTGQGGEPTGEWRTYACRACGFAQTFVTDCSAIPIGEKFGTRLLNGGEAEGPYR